jgi:hypothetical protein
MGFSRRRQIERDDESFASVSHGDGGREFERGRPWPQNCAPGRVPSRYSTM